MTDQAPSPKTAPEDSHLASPPRWLRGVLLASLLALTAAVHWPGYYHPDAVNIVWQNTGVIQRHNWGPPLLRDLYGIVLWPNGWPVALFIAQLALVAVAFELYARVVDLTGLIVFTILLALPPTLPMLGFVGKDPQLLTAFVALSALVLLGYRRGQVSGTAFAGLLALAAFAIIIRPNAVLLMLGAAPLLGAYLLALRRRRAPRAAPSWWPSALTGTAVLLVLSSGLLVLSGARAGVRLAPEAVLRGWDIAAVSIAEDRNLLPDSVAPSTGPCDVATLRKQYLGWSSGNLITADSGCVQTVRPETDLGAVTNPATITSAQWLSVIKRNPGAYLAHRLDVLAYLLGTHELVNGPYFASSSDLALSVDIDPADVTGMHRFAYPLIERLYVTASWVWRPWVWALVTIAAMLGLVGGRDARAAFSLAAGVALYLGSLIILAPAADARYFHPIWGLLLVVVPLGADRIRVTCPQHSRH